MKLFLKNKKNLNMYICIYIIISILLSRNTMITSCVVGFQKASLICMALAIPIYICFLKRVYDKSLDFARCKIVIFLLSSMVIAILIKRDWQLYNISVLFYIITAIVVATLIDFELFKKYYINIMLVLAICSLLTTYIAKPILIEMDIQEKLESCNLIIKNSSNYNFLNLGFGFALFQKDYIRNYGIFTEPSFYQFYLTVAIVMILFLKKNKTRIDWIILFILIITMVTTFSAAAMVILFCLAIVYIVELVYKNRKNKKNLTIIVCACGLLTGLMLSIPSTRNIVVTSYHKITTSNESSISRYGSLWFTLEKTIKSPIIGNKIAEISTYKESITNTTFAISAIYGVIPLIYTLYFTYKLASDNGKNNKILSIAIMAIIILSYNSHFYVGVQSFWMILLSTIKLNRRGENKNENTLDS